MKVKSPWSAAIFALAAHAMGFFRLAEYASIPLASPYLITISGPLEPCDFRPTTKTFFTPRLWSSDTDSPMKGIPRSSQLKASTTASAFEMASLPDSCATRGSQWARSAAFRFFNCSADSEISA